MKDADFKGIVQGLEEARALAQGRTTGGTKVHVPEEIDVAAIRRKAGVSQAAFAERIGVKVGTLRNWEQKRREPDGPARVLLALLARNPKIVEETLAA